MTNGRHALKGVEYQATVNLDLLLKYFHQTTESVVICPEDDDDLVIAPVCGGNKHFYQVKKPKEFDNGQLKNEPWSLVDIVQNLLIGTFERLNGNQHQQTWILGDETEPDVHALLSAGSEAPTIAPTPYLRTLHLLARKHSIIIPAKLQGRRQILTWKPPSGATVSSMISSFRQEAMSRGIHSGACDTYDQAVNKIHVLLPDVLERTSAETVYGADEALRERIQQTLKDRYGLDWETTKHTLVPGLRNFVYGVSSKIGKTINRTDFEAEIRNIWPRMTMVCAPPVLGDEDLPRETLVQEVLKHADQGPLEITGISGSGKTTLASELLEYLKIHETGLCPLYVAAKSDRSFRDVVAGIAFHLRGFGMDELFPIATRYSSSDERAMIEIAEKLASSALNVLVILDLVDGSCSDTFAGELSRFLENLTPGTFQFIVMGQESSFRMLSLLQRDTLGHPDSVDIPGFNFEEFVSLTGLANPNPPNRTDLWHVYNQFTAGRFSGLYARLAKSIADCDSVNEMKRLADMPPEKVLQEADRIRYNCLAKNLRQVADKLLCFMLPFRENEAVKLFPYDRVREAIQELVRHGLLRSLDNERFEFHETVRKGLGGLIPPAVSTPTHKAFSDYYRQRGEITAAIYHLEESGQAEKAHQMGRQTFLEGRFRSELEAYVTKHQLLSASDIVDLLIKEKDVGKYYMLPQMLKNIGHKDTANTLIQLARRDSDRFDKDYQWAWRITEAILVCEPSKLFELVLFGLEGSTSETEQDRLQYVIQGVRRPTVDSRLLALFNKKPETLKKRLVALLLMDKRREVLAPALSFLSSYESLNTRRGGRDSDLWIRSLLKLEAPADVQEFLAALPMPGQVSKMLAHRSVLLGRLESLVWAKRHVIQPQCIEILKQQSSEKSIIFNALRVLVFLQDERAVHFIEQTAKKEGQLKAFAAFIPTFYPHTINLKKYRARVLDIQLPLDERVVDFFIFSGTGGNIDLLLSELIATDTASAEAWKYFVVMTSMQHPCKSAVPIFEKMLGNSTDKTNPHALTPVVCKLGELPGDDVTDFLIRMLGSPWPNIPYMACHSLEQRRSQRALPALLELCLKNRDPSLVQLALVASIASGPSDSEGFADIWSRFPKTAIWRCILIERLGAVSGANWLVQVATDTTQHWQLRRATVLAASRLPFNAALEKIYPAVMKERSSFTIDDHPSLLMHNLMAPLILEEGTDLLRFFQRGKESFVKFWGDIFQTYTQDNIFHVAKHTGTNSAGWLFDRLTFYGWPNNQNAQDTILNELHVPIIHAAVLRGLRLTGRLDLIEKLLPEADTEWLLMRILCECAKHPEHTQEGVDRLRGLVAKSTFSESVSVNNCLKNISPKKERPIQPNRAGDYKNPPPTTLGYDDIMKALEIGQLPGKPPYVMVDLSLEQCSQLTKELDPSRDYETRWVATDPKLGFSHSGPSIKGAKHESIVRNKTVREALRPALAAANNFGVHMPWHPNLIAGIQGYGRYEHSAEKYCSAFLSGIGALRDSDRLYVELEKHSDLIMPKLSKIAYMLPIKKLIDERIVPYLRIYANAGSDYMLESLCALALCVENDVIDPVLAELFSRWYHRFDRSDKLIQYQGNNALWRAFNSMRKHPRFKNIPEHDIRLLEILDCNLYWIDRDNIIEAVSESPRSYTKIEKMLMKATPFEHFLWDEVDKLDKIAQILFYQVCN